MIILRAKSSDTDSIFIHFYFISETSNRVVEVCKTSNATWTFLWDRDSWSRAPMPTGTLKQINKLIFLLMCGTTIENVLETLKSSSLILQSEQHAIESMLNENIQNNIQY